MRKITFILICAFFTVNAFAQEIGTVNPITVEYMSEEPVIDGQIDGAWASLDEVKPANYFDRADPATGDLSEGDLEITMKIGWKGDFLYILMDQLDDVHVVDHEAQDVKGGGHNLDNTAYYFYLGEALTAQDTVWNRNDSVSFAIGNNIGDLADGLGQIYFGTEEIAPDGNRWNDGASITLLGDNSEYSQVVDGDRIITEWKIDLTYMAGLSGAPFEMKNGTKFHFDIERNENDLEFTNDPSGFIDFERQSQTFLGPDALDKPFAKYNKAYSWHPMVLSGAPTSISEQDNMDMISIYPNPSNSLINIDGNIIVSSVKVYNTTGQLVLSKENTSTNSIDISGLSNGIYLIHLLDKNTQTVVIKKITVK